MEVERESRQHPEPSVEGVLKKLGANELKVFA